MKRVVLKKCFLLLLSLGFAVFGRSQTPVLSCSPKDRAIFEDLMQELAVQPGGTVGETVVSVGLQFLGTPYVASTLESKGEEKLVVNFRGLDCTTFVENVLAIGRMTYEGRQDWESYLKTLEQIRYRGGKLKEYPSRLHYFTDWIRDNEKKGLVKDITPELGGDSVMKEINFMGTHSELYPALGQGDHLEEIRSIEASLSSEALCILPSEAVSGQEGLFRDGDIIALATKIQGLDVTHTGIALKGSDGRIHLLHASTKGAVMISEEPLSEYLKNSKGTTGVIVVRPLPPGS